MQARRSDQQINEAEVEAGVPDGVEGGVPDGELLDASIFTPEEIMNPEETTGGETTTILPGQTEDPIIDWGW